MRRLLIVLNILVVLGCHSEVDTAEKAALVVAQDFTPCASCGGWIVIIDKMSFRADLPAAFSQPNTTVWLRYEEDKSSEQKKSSRWIKVLSIRERMP